MPHAFDFTDRVVLIVGGSSGIGNAIAQAFRRHGASVHVWGTRAQATDYDGLPDSDLEGLSYTQVNVGSANEVATAAAGFKQLDVLVLSQGIVLYKRREFDLEGFRQVVDINLISLMSCAVGCQRLLARAQGSVIVIGSSAGFRATRGNPAYSASKAGAVGLIRTLGDAWAGEGVRVNGIAPGLIRTKLTQVTTENPARLAKMLERIPLGRLGGCEEIANVALFLASPLASYIVGETIMVDGGLTLA